MVRREKNCVIVACILEASCHNNSRRILLTIWRNIIRPCVPLLTQRMCTNVFEIVDMTLKRRGNQNSITSKNTRTVEDCLMPLTPSQINGLREVGWHCSGQPEQCCATCREEKNCALANQSTVSAKSWTWTSSFKLQVQGYIHTHCTCHRRSRCSSSSSKFFQVKLFFSRSVHVLRLAWNKGKHGISGKSRDLLHEGQLPREMLCREENCAPANQSTRQWSRLGWQLKFWTTSIWSY